MTTSKPATIDEYIAGFPAKTQALLQEIRATVQAAAPDATEAIRYAIPTFILNGNLVHFAGFKNHIGFYPAPTGAEAFKTNFLFIEPARVRFNFHSSSPCRWN